MAKRHKKRDARYTQFVVVVCLAAVVWLSLQLRETPHHTASPKAISTVQPTPNEQDGFEVFAAQALNISFLYPRPQAPIVASATTVHAAHSFQSRDFMINFYHGPGFVLQPWEASQSSLQCVYDGALHSFGSRSDGADAACRFEANDIRGTTVLYKEFTFGDVQRFLAVLPVNRREYFMVVYIDYIKDCQGRETVCSARSDQKRDKLTTFVSTLIEKNHNLFAQ